VSPEQLASEAAEYCRSLLLIKSGIEKASLLGAPVSAYDADVLAAFSSERIERALAGILDLYRNLRYTVDSRFELELAVARLCRLAEYVSPTELAAAVAALKRRLAGDAASSSADEKKKPEPSLAPAAPRERSLPPQLSAAFSSLAETARLSQPEAERAAATAESPRGAASPAPASRPAVLKDSAEGGDEEADEESDAPAGASGASAAPVQSDSLRASVIEAIGRSSPLLKTGLVSSLPWQIDEKRLVIPFRSGMEESVVRGSLAQIAAKASELAGRLLKVELKVERKSEGEAASAAKGEGGEADPVEIVERVFRGSRLSGRE